MWSGDQEGFLHARCLHLFGASGLMLMEQMHSRSYLPGEQAGITVPGFPSPGSLLFTVKPTHCPGIQFHESLTSSPASRPPGFSSHVVEASRKDMGWHVALVRKEEVPCRPAARGGEQVVEGNMEAQVAMRAIPFHFPHWGWAWSNPLPKQKPDRKT